MIHRYTLYIPADNGISTLFKPTPSHRYEQLSKKYRE